MNTKVVYISIAVTIESPNPIEGDIVEQVIENCEYDVVYDDGNGTKISKTEIKEVSPTYLQ